jgi:DNA-binding transcriptional LysR family regulator
MLSVPRLRLLLALHERGTLQAAASILHISTSAASQQLAALGKEAGVQLTETDGRRLRFTEAGNVLVGHAYALVAQIERAQGDILAAANGEVGAMTVGGFATAIPSLLIPAAGLVRRQRPRLEIDVREVAIQQGLSQLGSGDLDVVVAVESDDAPTTDAPRFSRSSLGVEDFDFAVSVAHPLAANPTAALGSLKAQDWVSTSSGDACDQLLHNACLAVGFRPRVRHRANDWLARRARLPIPAGALIVSPTERIQRHIYAIVRCGSTTHPAITTYLSALTQIVDEQ